MCLFRWLLLCSIPFHCSGVSYFSVQSSAAMDRKPVAAAKSCSTSPTRVPLAPLTLSAARSSSRSA
ncbi:hypothetical protein PF010_g8546 [Phytophthora fragariae]|uniref:RxLR effector protein n=1 Tax=Phytophthora fragariae TaxID=53985 RepID=A0A6A3FIB5_9STRA|nr:hypothetical protein PF003_g10633 [Phytophthora fragariae]KAE8945824.1 hypothetical protein PF009_g4544 [Phytophthora fragariae]KAE9117614.1 hypothetical protein PF010_g8546 [Phytophthora fragariae]KAE9128403.1 hypothetical protein PF007_g5280 [Phytophthora fragariae]KAE9145598.1 hypothetical protein PF006_g9569 [Phytophthora fragariae]